MRRKEITTTIGTINLNDVEFCENSFDVFIGIESVSEDIQEKISKAVEIAKAEHLQVIKEYVEEHNSIYKDRVWTDEGINMDLSLHIIVDNKTFSYRIEIDITDKADDMMWTSASVDVDLSEYQSKLKKVIVKAMIDKFFQEVEEKRGGGLKKISTLYSNKVFL